MSSFYRRIACAVLSVCFAGFIGSANAAGWNNAASQQATQQMIDAMKESNPDQAETIDQVQQGVQQYNSMRSCHKDCNQQQSQCTSSCGSSSANRSMLNMCLSNCNQQLGSCVSSCN